MNITAKSDLPSRTLRKRERTRSELVSAAERLVAARGIDAISIDDITEAADVAKGTFYTHFDDKDDLASVIANRIRLELEEKIETINEANANAAERMANGLSSLFAFAIRQPVRARALLRLIPGSVDPDAPINAGIRGDIVLGLKSKSFTATSLSAAVVATIGIAMSAAMHLTGPKIIAEPYGFAADILATALVSLGMKPSQAARLAQSAMSQRKKEYCS